MPRQKSKVSEKVKKVLKPSSKWYKNTNELLFVIGIIIITFICFTPALDNKKEFTNWDDPVYVTEQKIITKLDLQNIVEMFSIQNPVSLNYHPVTVLSLAVNYHFSKLKPSGYFWTNIFFHLLNTFLVFIFIYRLTKNKFWVAALSALFFGIHPMHVESVAWISERKDVLYCFFFLLSCISYLKYLDGKKWLMLVICFLFFVLSCLSKGMAVVLPVVLIFIDIFHKRKLNLKVWLEKIPFLIVSVLLGIITVQIQATGAIAKANIVTLLQRFDFASYGFLMYWVKLFLPINLSAYYKYPNINKEGTIPLIYHLAPFIAIAFVVALLYYTFKKDKTKFNIALFGMGFFISTIVFVLQFIMVGSAMMADRYSYLPYIGSFFMIFSFLGPRLENQKTKKMVIGISLSIALLFSFLCYQRVKVWNDNDSLWTDVIEKYPYKFSQTGNLVMVEQTGVPTAYKNRGKYYRDIGKLDKAFADFDILIKTNTADAGDCSNMGNLYALRAKEMLDKGNQEAATQLYDKALEIYNKGLLMETNNFEIYIDRGITYNMMGKHAEAIENFKRAQEIDPTKEYLNTNLAFEYLQLRNYDESIKYCNIHLLQFPNDALALFYRGTSYFNLGNIENGITDLTKATGIDPSNANAWFNLSMAQNKSGQFKAALVSVSNAQKNGYTVAPSYLQELKSKAQ